MHSHRHCAENGTYIVTNDVGDRFQGLTALGLKVPKPDHPVFVKFHDNLKDMLSECLPDVSVVSYDMSSLADKVLQEAIHHQGSIRNSIVVSSCVEIASRRRGHTIEINRIFDHHGELIGFGPRPGNPSLSSQIRGIVAASNGNPVVLVEDGAFTGSTLDHLVMRLTEAGVNVTTVIIGICFPGARENIEKSFRGDIISVEQIDRPYEWMPDHDFIPFAPNCGRVFGGRFGEEYLPHHTFEGMSYSFPYILPFGNPTKWAGIPKDRAVDFSRFCLSSAREIFDCIEELNCREILVRDLLGSKPCASAPMTAGNTALPNIDETVIQFLNNVCRELN